MHLEHLYIYPVKSLGGIAVSEAKLEKRGLAMDRRYMLVDEHGHFITQRVVHSLALIKLSLSLNGFTITPSGELGTQNCDIPRSITNGEAIKVKVWDDAVDAIVADDSINNYFSTMLSMKCKLVYMPDQSLRQVEPKYAAEGDITSFSDAYPLLLIGSQSLTDLNNRLQNPIGWERFRPNLVIKTNSPYEEDTWRTIQLGNAQLKVAKPCSRCVMTTIDQNTAIASKEPLRTLATYRTVNNKINFGQNVIPKSEGVTLKLNDTLVIN
jgi:uncharacterized protein